MKYAFYLLFSLLLLSCRPAANKNSSVDLFNGIHFQYTGNEIIKDIDRSTSKFYNVNLNTLAIQIPLFKHFTGPQYDLYLGVPFNTSLEELRDSLSRKNQAAKGILQKGDNFVFCQYQKDSLAIIEYALSLKNKSIIYLAVTTPRKQILDSLFQADKLRQRFVTE